MSGTHEAPPVARWREPSGPSMTDADARLDTEIGQAHRERALSERRSGFDRRGTASDPVVYSGRSGPLFDGEPVTGFVQHPPAYRHPHGPQCEGLGLHSHVVNAAGRATGFPEITESEQRALHGDR